MEGVSVYNVLTVLRVLMSTVIAGLQIKGDIGRIFVYIMQKVISIKVECIACPTNLICCLRII